MITIGIDPHKSSFTAVAVDASGHPVAQRRFVVNAGTFAQLTKWAQAWPQRRFAVEGACRPGSASSWSRCRSWCQALGSPSSGSSVMIRTIRPPGCRSPMSMKGPLILFFGPDGERQPEREIRERKAKAVCMRGPVRGECLDYAVSRPEKYGLYGGLNEDDLM